MGRLVLRFVFTVAGLVLAGCNALSGADDLVLLDDDAGDGGGSSTSGSGGFGTAVQNMVPADGVTITSIALYQGVRRPLMDGGQPTPSSIPIVAGREGVLRVFYATDGGYDGQPVVARLTIGTAPPLETVLPLGASSNEAAPESTINFQLAGSMLEPSSSYLVEILRPEGEASGSNQAARYPTQDAAPLDASSGAEQLRVVLVPIRYDGDGSGRMPDTSAAQQARYRDRFFQLYPTASVELRVGASTDWPGAVLADGTGWNSLLNAMVDFRANQGAADDEYYYGVFSPGTSMNGYCGGACVSGLSTLAGPQDAWGRVGIGVGFTGAAPCAAFNGIDPAFPHPQGGIGGWGYDLLGSALVDPAGHSDFMGYCTPTWVSGYTFAGLFERMALVNGASSMLSAPVAEPQRFERLELGAEGHGRWLAPLDLPRAPSGVARAIELEDAHGGRRRARASFHPYSHLPGGLLLVPRGARRASALKLADRQGARWIRR
jgi:hypothetical protein